MQIKLHMESITHTNMYIMVDKCMISKLFVIFLPLNSIIYVLNYIIDTYILFIIDLENNWTKGT